MDESRWERSGATAGIVFFVLLAASVLVAPTPPHIDATTTRIATYFNDHRTAIISSNLLWILAGVAFVWFLGHLRHVLQRAEGGMEALSPVVFGSGVALVAAGGIAVVPVSTLALMARSQEGLTNPSVVRMLYDMRLMADPGLALAAALFVLAGSLAMVRKELVSPALGWVGMIVAAVDAIGGVATLYQTRYNSFWFAYQWVALFAFGVWILAASAAMVTRPEVERATARQPVFTH
jgi:hypothetical protein